MNWYKLFTEAFPTLVLILIIGFVVGCTALYIELYILPGNSSKMIKKNKKKTFQFEVCLSDIESARQAMLGGADRVELCDNLKEGGTTPSFGLIKQAVYLLHPSGVSVHVLIRPRPGDFYYSTLEYQVMIQDITTCRKLGVAGIVIGLLNKDGSIDVERTKKLISIARPMTVTFHRAFDVCANPEIEFQKLIDLEGIDFLLTSGQAASALEGTEVIKKMIKLQNENENVNVNKRKKKIEIIAAGGINSSNVMEIVDQSLVGEIHIGSGCTIEIESEMIMRKENVNMGKEINKEYVIQRVSKENVDEINRLAEEAYSKNIKKEN